MLLSIVWTVAALVAVHTPNAPAARVELIDQRGTAFAFEQLAGTPLVVTFVSAHCSDACPILEAQIARCVDSFGHSPFAIRFLTLTLDPERDTPLDMRRIAKVFDADPQRWIVATGAPPGVHALMHRFGVRTQRDAHGYATAHTTLVYLLDAHLHLVRTLFASDDLNAGLLEEDLAQ